MAKQPVAWKNGTDNRTPLYIQTKYANSASPIPIASYKEAQLIVAEVAQGQTAVNIINNLRAAKGLPAFSSTDPVAIAAEVTEARRRELFLAPRAEVVGGVYVPAQARDVSEI